MRTLLNTLSGLILRLTLPLTVFLIPLVFAPITPDFALVKQLALVIIASLAALAWAVQTVIRQKIIITITPATIPALVLGLIYVVSALLQSSSRSLAFQGEVTTIVALIVIFLVTTFTLSAKSHLRFTLKALFASLGLLSLWVVAESTGLISRLTDNPLLNQAGFNPVGGPLPYLALALPTVLVVAYLAFKVEKTRSKLVLFALTILVAVAVFISIKASLPGAATTYQPLPLKAGWEIAVAVLGRTRTSLLGTGPESFATTFTQARPAWLNTTPLWNLRFTFSTNFVLQLLTTVGLLGTGAWLFLMGKTFITHINREKLHNPLSTALRLFFLGVVVVWFLVPLPTILLLTLMFVALTLLALDLKSTGITRDLRVSLFAAEIIDTPKKELWSQTPQPAQREMLTWILLGIVILLIAFSLLFKGRAFAAQTYLLRSMQAASSDGQTAYDNQAKAISLDPQNPILHLQAAALDFGLAQTLSKGENLSDEDKKLVSQLIQEAINEAKIATNLDRQNTLAWQNLANLYRQLIEQAQGADQWATTALSQAINLDPTNALLRMQLGEIYFVLKNYNEAANFFSQSIQLKGDLANAHYGLALTFNQVKDYISALRELKIVLSLLPQDSEEYRQISDEIAQVEPMAAQQEEQLKAQEEKNSQVEGAQDQNQELSPPSEPTPTPLELQDNSGQNLSPTPFSVVSPPVATEGASPTP